MAFLKKERLDRYHDTLTFICDGPECDKTVEMVTPPRIGVAEDWDGEYYRWSKLVRSSPLYERVGAQRSTDLDFCSDKCTKDWVVAAL